MSNIDILIKRVEDGDLLSYGDGMDLIREIEQLKKEKEWLLEQCVELTATLHDYGIDKSRASTKREILKQMQQALKGE